VAAVRQNRKAIVSCPRRDLQVESVVAQLVARGFDVSSESSVLRTTEGRIDSEQACPLNLLLSRPKENWKEWLFRLRDLALAFPGLVVLAPLFALIGLAIRIDSRGPIFFRQRRL